MNKNIINLLSLLGIHFTFFIQGQQYLDTSFGPDQNGIVILNTGSVTSLSDIAIQTDNKIVVSGSFASETTQTLVARYLPDGTLDATFGTDGLTTVLTGSGSEGHAHAIDSSGNIVIAGESVSTEADITLWRFTADGSLDSTFGTSGTVTTALNDGAAANDLALQPSDEKIVVTGPTVASGIPQIFVARYTTSGVLDTTYGTSGITQLQIFDNAFSNTIIIQSDDKAICAGRTDDGSLSLYSIVRFTSSGDPDSSFGSSGIVTGQSTSSTFDVFYALGLQSSGKIIAAGTATIDGQEETLVARFNTNGTLDTTFGSSGYATNTFGESSGALALTIQSDDSIVISGFADAFPFTARLTVDGALDSSFGNEGVVITDTLDEAAFFNAVTVDSSDKILAVGVYDIDGLLIRYQPNNSDFINIFNPAESSTISSFPTTISGNASQSNSTVSLEIDSIAIGATITDSLGNWIFSYPLISNGAHTITANLLDSLNTIIATSSNDFTVSSSDAIEIVSPTQDEIVLTAFPTITGLSSESSATVEVFIDSVSIGTALTNAIGSWSIDSPQLSNASHTAQANLLPGATDSVTFTVSAAQGTTGATGPAGATGATGPCCPGATGATGATTSSNDYMYSYHTGNDTLAISNTFQNIVYNNPLTQNSGWSMSSTGAFTNSNSGIYLVAANIVAQFSGLMTVGVHPSSLRLMLNGSQVPGASAFTTTDNNLARSQTSINTIINYTANQPLVVQWTGDITNFTLSARTSPNQTASSQITIERLQ